MAKMIKIYLIKLLPKSDRGGIMNCAYEKTYGEHIPMKKALLLILSVSLILLSACSLNKDKSLPNPSPEKESVQESAKANSADNLLLTLDDSSYREVNLFLTCFSEVFYDPSLGFLSEAEEKINFAYLNATIYSKDMTFYKDKCCGISLGTYYK